MSVVRAAITVECSEHRKHRVRRRERLWAVGFRGDGMGALGVAAARGGVTSQPESAGAPGEKKREVVCGAARLVRRAVELEGLGDAAAEVIDQTQTPGESARERLGGLRCALVAGDRTVPVSAHLSHLSCELRERHLEPLVW